MGRWSITRVILFASISLIAVILVIFLIALGMALSDAVRWSPVITIFRNVVLLIFATIGILVIVSLAILSIQFARFIQLLRREVSAILENTQATVSDARGTVEFVGENVTEPLIQSQTFLTGLFAFLREVVALWKLFRVSNNDLKSNSAHPQPNDNMPEIMK